MLLNDKVKHEQLRAAVEELFAAIRAAWKEEGLADLGEEFVRFRVGDYAELTTHSKWDGDGRFGKDIFLHMSADRTISVAYTKDDKLCLFRLYADGTFYCNGSRGAETEFHEADFIAWVKDINRVLA